MHATKFSFFSPLPALAMQISEQGCYVASSKVLCGLQNYDLHTWHWVQEAEERLTLESTMAQGCHTSDEDQPKVRGGAAAQRVDLGRQQVGASPAGGGNLGAGGVAGVLGANARVGAVAVMNGGQTGEPSTPATGEPSGMTGGGEEVSVGQGVSQQEVDEAAGMGEGEEGAEGMEEGEEAGEGEAEQGMEEMEESEEVLEGEEALEDEVVLEGEEMEGEGTSGSGDLQGGMAASQGQWAGEGEGGEGEGEEQGDGDEQGDMQAAAEDYEDVSLSEELEGNEDQ